MKIQKRIEKIQRQNVKSSARSPLPEAVLNVDHSDSSRGPSRVLFPTVSLIDGAAACHLAQPGRQASIPAPETNPDQRQIAAGFQAAVAHTGSVHTLPRFPRPRRARKLFTLEMAALLSASPCTRVRGSPYERAALRPPYPLLSSRSIPSAFLRSTSALAPWRHPHPPG